MWNFAVSTVPVDGLLWRGVVKTKSGPRVYAETAFERLMLRCFMSENGNCFTDTRVQFM